MPITGWPKKISWKNFQKVDAAPANVDGQAYTFTEFSFNYSGTKRDKRGFRLIGIEVKVSINTSNSWVVKGTQHPDLLIHEQGHYDITGLVGGRELLHSLQALRAVNRQRLVNQVETTYTRIGKKVKRLHIKYDKETKPSDGAIDPKQQAVWNKRIKVTIRNSRRWLPNP